MDLTNFQKSMTGDEAILSKCIPDFLPVVDSFKESNVLPTIGFLMISLHLSSALKMSEWKMIFSIERDGVAYQTFYSMLEEHENTVIIIKDENDQINFTVTANHLFSNLTKALLKSTSENNQCLKMSQESKSITLMFSSPLRPM
jgi:hypothetical protein